MSILQEEIVSSPGKEGLDKSKKMSSHAWGADPSQMVCSISQIDMGQLDVCIKSLLEEYGQQTQ